jgi:3',5'-cyclic AMP phosphodiesterase CpdA
MKRIEYPLLTIGFSMFIFGFISGCDKFEYSPYQTHKNGSPEGLNQINIKKLSGAESSSDDTVTILFTGDSQRFYNSLDALVQKSNSLPEVDFLILAGDISDFGLLQEFTWVYKRLESLKVPYLCVVGNHDLTANGAEIYSKMFGPKNFSFHYKGYKFLFHDTNGREYGFNGNVPDMNWLSGELKDTSQWFVGVSHVPPYDVDFDASLEEKYHKLFAETPGFILSLNGHLHNGGQSYHYNDHVRYITSFAVDKNKCLLLKLFDGKISTSEVYY